MAPASFLRDPEALLTHGDFVRALARSLLDEHRAEDVVQQTWVAAIERPPRATSLRAWLAVVARNLALRSAREEGRRARREAGAARPDRVPSTEEVLDREAARRRVVEAVVALSEPYRSAVLLRYFESLPPRAIAARLGVPVGTVKTRLKRALEQLRLGLDRERGGDGRAWALALAPLAAPAPIAAGAAGAIPGILAMKTGAKAGWAAAILLGGSAAVRWMESSGASPEPSPPPAIARTSTAASLGVREGSEPPLPPEPVAAAALLAPGPVTRLPAEPSRVEIPGLVVDDRGSAVAGAHVLADGRRFETDGNGEFRASLPRAGETTLLASHPDHFLSEANVEAPEGPGPHEPIRLRLDRKLSIAGIVLDDRGVPAGGATVRASQQDERPSIWWGADRTARLFRAASLASEVRRAAGRELARAPEEGRLLRIALCLSRNLPEGAETPGRIALAVAPTIDLPLRAADQYRLKAQAPTIEATAGPDGRFVLFPLRPGRWDVGGDAYGGPIEARAIDLEAPLPDLVLDAFGGRIHLGGRVLDCASGEPIPGARVTLAAVSDGRLLLETDTTTAEPTAGDGEPEEPADPPGTFRLSAWEKSLVEHPPTRLLAHVGAKGYATLVLELDPEGPGLEDLGICLGRSETATGGIEGEVVYDDGARFEGPVHLHLRSAGAEGVEERNFQDGEALYASEGIFVAEGIRPGDWLARPAIPGGIDLGWELARVVRVTPGARTRIRWTLPRGGDLCVEAKDERGSPVPEFALRIEHASRSIEARGAGGRALLRNVPPGTYRLAPEGSPATPVPDVVVVERGERSTLVVRFPAERGD